ncbi:unnamed protein product [Blepharisma stoltei]|uniref:Uncharacterized protein n=1 Tax=Blepharisma stoltei TaxID=1481888 RepID=A0AAU9IH33_9CILI|nr:unnamed protein product [Blepharisma stoltei]
MSVSSYLQWVNWKKQQESHKKKIEEIQRSHSSLDNLPPKRYNHCYNSKSLTDRFLNEKISKENSAMLSRLSSIINSPPNVQISQGNNELGLWSQTCKAEKRRKLSFDNIALAKRIINTKSQINFSKFEEEYKQSVKYSDIRRKRKNKLSTDSQNLVILVKNELKAMQ